MIRELKECYRIQDRSIKNNAFYLEGVSTWPKVLEAMEEERRFKRWNKSNIERINARLKQTGCNIDYIFLCKGRYTSKGHEICLRYTEKRIPEYRHDETLYHVEYEYIDLCELDGAHIIEQVTNLINGRLEYAKNKQDQPTLAQLEAFYADLEALKEKHTCFERGIYLLTDRHAS